MRIRSLSIVLLSLALFGPPLIQACSSHSETTTRETTVTTSAPGAEPTTTTTTTTTTKTDDEPDSVIGATVHAVGTIILFPFRLIGDAIGLLV
jgi:hypothetical protein